MAHGRACAGARDRRFSQGKYSADHRAGRPETRVSRDPQDVLRAANGCLPARPRRRRFGPLPPTFDRCGRVDKSERPRTADDRTIAAYAAEVLDRRVKKARKQGKQLSDLDPGQRHKLRIRIKKIRYAADFFGSLYRNSDQNELAGFSARLKRIQSALGSLNDFMAHRELAIEAALAAPPANRRAQAFAAGFIVGQEREAAQDLMEDASRELHRLRRLSVQPGK